MNNSDLNEQELYHFFNEDSKKVKPDESVIERLIYFFHVKSSTYRIKQNSFSGLFSWLFNLNNLPLKAAIVSVILVFTLVNFHQQTPIPGLNHIDSASFNNSLYLDSAMLLPFNSDTCYLKL